MAEQSNYSNEDFRPGDLITAEGINLRFGKLKDEINEKHDSVSQDVTELEEEFKNHLKAIDAHKLAGKTPEEWGDKLDKRYAPNEGGPTRYQRYFLELERIKRDDSPRIQPAVIWHGMGRIPIVQVYQLLPLPLQGVEEDRVYRLCFTGPSYTNDPQTIDLKTRAWDERLWGDELEHLINELALRQEDPEAFRKKFLPDETLEVWVRHVRDALVSAGPSQTHYDIDDFYYTQWFREHRNTPVEELKKRGEWPPRFISRPRMVQITGRRPTTVAEGDEVEGLFVEIYHINLNEVEIAPDTGDEAHLMVILRS